MTTEPPEAPRSEPPAYWPLALGNAIVFYVVVLIISPAIDLAFGDPIDLGSTAREFIVPAVLFGLAMAWWTRRKARKT